MSDVLHTGGCHCGALRYQITEPLGFAFLCTCDNCRKLSQGARLAGVGVPGGFTLSGPARVYDYQGGKDIIHLHFCGECSTAICAVPEAYPGLTVLRIGTLDDQDAVPKVKRIFRDQACAWEPWRAE